MYRYLSCDLPFRINAAGFPARRGRGLLLCIASPALVLVRFALAFRVSPDAVKRRAWNPESALY